MPLNPILCTKCNSVNRPQAKFCHECGSRLTKPTLPHDNKPHPVTAPKDKFQWTPKQTTTIFVLLVLLTLVLIMAGVMIVYWLASGGSLSGLF